MSGHIIVICGHYGTGKTNFALNMALNAAAAGKRVVIADLDIVNPYFRTSEYSATLENRGVKVISPSMAGTTLDTPSLSPELFSLFDSDSDLVIIDAGGDDVGAKALGRLAHRITEAGYEMLYVINRQRGFVSTPEQAIGIMREIESASHLRVTGIINNTHIASLTQPSTVLDSADYAAETAKLAGLPLVATTVPSKLAEQLSGKVENLYPVDIIVRLPWDV